MCLFIKKFETDVAKEDIVCYKLLVEEEYKNGTRIVTPYFKTVVEPECLNGNELFCPETEEPDINFDPYNACFIASDGLIHSFKRRWTARKLARKNPKIHTRIYRCIIPAGTEYFYGKDQATRRAAYASKAIKFVEET